MPIIGAAVVPHPPIILPDIGRGEEQKIAATTAAYEKIAADIAALRPDTIVVTSPHALMYADYFHVSPGASASGDFARFGFPNLKFSVDYDEDFVATLKKIAGEKDFPAGTLGDREPALDHGTMIPLYFIEKEIKIPWVRIGLSGLPMKMHYELGQMLRAAADKLERRVFLVASGDLSHKLKDDGPYGFAAEGPEFDERTMAALEKGDFLSLMEIDDVFAKKAAECGLRSFWIMAGAFDGQAVKTENLAHEGPFGVGYGVSKIMPVGKDESRHLLAKWEEKQASKMKVRREREDDLVKLARNTLEKYVTTREVLAPENLPAELTENRGACFVSLKKHGQLRGCIGTFLPTRNNLAAEIIGNAIAAGTEDPRFDPVKADELKDIVYSVDVLSTPVPVSSEKELDPKKYGIIVECQNRRGLLLPDLEGVDTVDEQINIARQKGNIAPHERVQLYRFTVVRHH